MNEMINTETTTAGRLALGVLSASTLIGDDVYNIEGEKLGDITELMIDIENGKVRYAVLSFAGFLSLGEKLFALPWSALTVDTENKCFVIDADCWDDQFTAEPARFSRTLSCNASSVGSGRHQGIGSNAD